LDVWATRRRPHVVGARPHIRETVQARKGSLAIVTQILHACHEPFECMAINQLQSFSSIVLPTGPEYASERQ
jgi:hypothetical protein